MQILNPGHVYQLANHQSIGTQEITFVMKAPTSPGSKELETVLDGTTNEEVLAMLIDRIRYLNEKVPCRENSIVITKLEESLMWLEKRTADRVARGVENTHNK